MKQLIFSFIALLVSAGAMAAAVLDPTDVSEGDWRSVALVVGILAASVCQEQKDLIRFGKVTQSLEVICKWSFRIATILLLIPLFGRATGWWLNMDADVGWRVLALWSVLRAAQALYVSGVSYGVRESVHIMKKINAPRDFF